MASASTCCAAQQCSRSLNRAPLYMHARAAPSTPPPPTPLPADLAPIRGPIQYRHAFLDMRGLRVEASDFTRAGRTCKPAMGFAFAAGTTDGGGGAWGWVCMCVCRGVQARAARCIAVPGGLGG